MMLAIKQPSTWIGLMLYLIPLGLALSGAPEAWSWPIYVAFVGAAVAVFLVNEKLRQSSMSRLRRAENIKAILENVNLINAIQPSGIYRANVFELEEKTKSYVIRHSCNMDNDQDRSIKIPENLGCTGQSWLTGNQVFCNDKSHFLHRGDNRIPELEAKKIREDLEWICTTPVKQDQKVVAVLGLDGNQKLNEDQIKLVKQFGNRVAKSLEEIYQK